MNVRNKGPLSERNNISSSQTTPQQHVKTIRDVPTDGFERLDSRAREKGAKEGMELQHFKTEQEHTTVV